MIRPEKFYDGKDNPSMIKRKKMWRNIERGLDLRMYQAPFHFKSFAFGMAASVILFFTSIGIYNTVQNYFDSKKPGSVKINNAYREIIYDLEKIIPAKISAESIAVDEFIRSRREKLENIDKGIYELQAVSRNSDFSTIKQERLRELYLMKLRIIEEIIKMEEK